MSLTFSADDELATRPVNIGFHFTLLIGLETVGDFQAIEGISFSAPIKKYNEGGRNHSPHLLRWDAPGERGEVTLRWGMMTRAALYQWASAVERGYIFRKPVYILQLDRDKVPMRLICLFSAFPVRWSMGSLDANSNNWSVEEVVLAYEDIGMLALNESLVDALGGLIGNFFNSGTKIGWEDGTSIEWETSSYGEQELEAYQELSEWEEDQQNLDYLFRNWENMSEEDRVAYMAANGLTAADIAGYAWDNEDGDWQEKLEAALAALEGTDGEEDESSESEAFTPSGTSLSDVESAIGDTTAPTSGFVEANTGGRSEADATAAAYDPTAGTIGRSDEDEEDEDAEAEEEEERAVPRAFASNGTGGTSLFDADDTPLSGFDEENLGGLSLEDAESALSGDALSGFDEENVGGTSLEDAESDSDEDTGA